LRVLEDIWSARQPSTIQKYCYSLRNLFSFSIMVNGSIILPVGTLSTAKFLTYLRNSSYSKSSIKLALVSLKWINSFFPGVSGANDPLKDEFLNKIVDSSQRNMNSKKNQKLPFSAKMIKKMVDVDPNETLENLRNALIPALGFSLLLRHDELSHILLAHMTLCQEGMKILIPSSTRGSPNP
jgi:site-specific recombinase XerD